MRDREKKRYVLLKEAFSDRIFLGLHILRENGKTFGAVFITLDGILEF